jgi:hypothetical protein
VKDLLFYLKISHSHRDFLKPNLLSMGNIVGNPHFIHPDFPGGPPTMFICGNDDEAKNAVIDNILTKFGWETIDIGGIEGARLLEPLAFLWIMHYFRTGNGNLQTLKLDLLIVENKFVRACNCANTVSPRNLGIG